LPRFVLRNGKPLILIDLAEHPVRVRPTQLTGELPPRMGGSLLAAGVRSLMILPLNSGGRVLGYLSFGKTTPRYYNQDDLQLAYLFSTLLATALNNSRLYDAEVHRARQLQMLSEIGQTATSILESETLLSRVSPLVRVHFGYDVAKIGLLQGDEVVYAAAAHPPPKRG
jgi:GAF domain-containing protein